MRASAFPNSGLHVGMCVVRARVRFPSPTAPPIRVNGTSQGEPGVATREGKGEAIKWRSVNFLILHYPENPPGADHKVMMRPDQGVYGW